MKALDGQGMEREQKKMAFVQAEIHWMLWRASVMGVVSGILGDPPTGLWPASLFFFSFLFFLPDQSQNFFDKIKEQEK